MTVYKNINRFSIKQLTVYAAVVSFLLFDNYIKPPGIRPFDFLGWAILFAAALMGWLDVRLGAAFSDVRFKLIAAIVLPTVVLGVLLQKSWAVLPFALGFVSLFILTGSRLFETNLLGILKFSLLILTFGLFVQFLLFITTGEITSLLLLVTEKGTRSDFGGLFYRVTGLYIEPGSHSLAVFPLMCAYSTLIKRKDWVTALAAIGIVLSLSLAGALAVLAFYAIPVASKFNTRLVKSLVIVICLVYLGYAVARQFDVFQLGILNRIDTVLAGRDGSVNDRFMINDEKCHDFLFNNALIFPLLGSGVSSDAFTPYCGSNNLAWMLFSIGYLGTFILFLLVFYSIRRAPLIVLACLYILFASQLSSYGFFWLYAAMLTVMLRKRLAEKKLNPMGNPPALPG